MKLSPRALPLALVFTLTLLVGCEVGTRVGVDGGGGGGIDGDISMIDTGPRPMTDSGPARDPFDPANACGLSVIPTERVPGSLLIVFDRSGSMDTEVGGSTRWNLATQGINNVLGQLGDELGAGLMLFPGGSDCSVDGSPNVPIAPLSTSRSMISGALSSASPTGGTTPAFEGLEAGYDYLDTLSTPGQRGIVLVTDGGENCDEDRTDAVLTRVQTEHDTKQRLTFAVGLDYADNNLSTIAFNGGTPRTADCLPECTGATCFEDSDCDTGTCLEGPEVAGFATPGTCGCNSTADCASPLTCEEPDSFCAAICGFPGGFCPPECAGATCQGQANCCHYNAAAGDFQSEFEAALDEIARRLLDSCVFEVPRGTNPSEFDPNQVNVGVTFEGEERNVLRRGTDSGTDSWNYTSADNESLIIQGPICERLLGGENATVEIVLGCVTLI